MPGGSEGAWELVKPILQAISAKIDGDIPCCEWMGTDGAGHYVKMVHNGIEYGFKQPLSQFGPGFDNFFSGYLWNSVSDDGWLYIGTYDWSVFLTYLPVDRWPRRMAQLTRYLPLPELPRKLGGFDLWRSRDGLTWEAVTRDGFGNPFNYGARRMVSTPRGLFVGTANPFGPEVANLDENGDWGYQHNPRGGLEVWWSQREPTGEVAS